MMQYVDILCSGAECRNFDALKISSEHYYCIVFNVNEAENQRTAQSWAVFFQRHRGSSKKLAENVVCTG